MRRAAWWAVGGGALAIAAVVAASVAGASRSDVAPPTSSPGALSTEASDPDEAGEFAADDTVYDLTGLPQVDVFALLPALPVDDDPTGPLPGTTARAASADIPVFAAPGSPPVASLPRDFAYDGTTVAVVEQHTAWMRVLLPGRQATPSSGDPAQLTGWVRAQDVELGTVDSRVEVDLAARTIDIVSADGARERVADDFGSGGADTPTPTGRSFIMLERAEPTLEYTDGYPLVYLAVQSPVLDGFGGADVAVTAFHYHDDRSGAISNGCLRVDAAAILRLAQLPLGTPVVIR